MSSLDSKLRRRTDFLGSTLYNLTWKKRDTPSGLSISALRASARRTSAKDSTSSPTRPKAGYVTPSARDWKDTPGMALYAADGRKRIDQLPRIAAVMDLPVENCRFSHLQKKSTDSGKEPNGPSAKTKSSVLLNPELARWLMGLPSIFCECAVTETAS